jgi:hypothetical protein
MVLQSQHIGLFFGQDHLDAVQAHSKDNAIIESAQAWLRASEGTIVRESYPDKGEPIIRRKPALTPQGQALADAYAYRFFNDEAAGKRARDALQSLGLEFGTSTLTGVYHAINASQLHEMVYPLWDGGARGAWLGQYITHTDLLLRESDDYVVQAWQMLLRIVRGILTDDHALFEQGASAYRAIIDQHIHPDGYIKPIAQEKTRATYRRMMQTTAALTFAAEAAAVAGVDLWSYEFREVGVHTAASYVVFYYFYPEKWHWSQALTADDTQAAFADVGAFVEITSHRAYANGVEILLDEQRPIFSDVGGLTSLTHFETQASPQQTRKKRGGWFFGLGGKRED